MPSRGCAVHIGVAILLLITTGRSSTCEEEEGSGASIAHSVSLLQHSLDLQGRGASSPNAIYAKGSAVNEQRWWSPAQTVQNGLERRIAAMPDLIPNVSIYTVRVLGFDAIAVCIVIVLVSWWQSDERYSENTVPARSALLDNAKVLGSCLVIYNHLMYNALEKSGTIVPVSLLLNRDFSFVVNPTFVFVSGITSQGGPTVKRIRRYVQFLVIPTILFHMILQPYLTQNMAALDLSRVRNQAGHIWHDLMDRFSHLPDWYLTALCLWRGCSYAVWSHIPKYFSFPLMIALACAAGYFPLPNMLNPFFSYMPIFGFGYCFPLAAVERAVPKPSKLVSACVIILVAGHVSIIMPGLFPHPNGSDPFTGVLPDAHSWYGGEDHWFSSAAPWDYSLWWSRRLAKLFGDIVSPLALIFLVLPRQETVLTYAGQHTLYSYLTQPIVMAWRTSIFLLLPICDKSGTSIYLTGFFGQVLKIILYIPFTIFLFVLVTSSYWRAIFSWGLTPKWLDPAFDRIETSCSDWVGTDAQTKADIKYIVCC